MQETTQCSRTQLARGKSGSKAEIPFEVQRPHFSAPNHPVQDEKTYTLNLQKSKQSDGSV